MFILITKGLNNINPISQPHTVHHNHMTVLKRCKWTYRGQGWATEAKAFSLLDVQKMQVDVISFTASVP